MRPEAKTRVRRVLLMLEVETDLPLSDLRSLKCYADGRVWCAQRWLTVLQAQANVIREAEPKKKGRKGR